MIENVIVRQRRTFLGGSGMLGGMLPRGVRHAPPKNFENVGSLKPNFPQEVHVHVCYSGFHQ